MKEDIKVIKQYIKTFNDRKLREEYRLYTSLERPTILENYSSSHWFQIKM